MGLIISLIVIALGANTPKFWPDAPRAILVIAALMMLIAVVTAPSTSMLHTDEEMAARWTAANLAFNFAMKLIQATVLFMLGFGIGVIIRRRQKP